MSGNVQSLSQETFDATLNDVQKPVLVDFWAPWCGPCKAIAPVLEELASEMDDQVQIYKINVDENAELAGKFGVQAIPTLLLFKNGEVAERVVGLANKEDLKAKILAHA